MGQLRERMIQDLKLAGYSPSTQRIYLLYAKKFAQHFRRSPEILGEREIRRYLLHLYHYPDEGVGFSPLPNR